MIYIYNMYVYMTIYVICMYIYNILICTIYIYNLICVNLYTHRSILESLCYFLSASVPGSHSPRSHLRSRRNPAGQCNWRC